MSLATASRPSWRTAQNRVLGAHVVGPEAAEVVNLFAFAMRSGLKARDLKYAKFVYPTAASDLEYMLP